MRDLTPRFEVVDRIEFIPAGGSTWIFVAISLAGVALTVFTLVSIYKSQFFREYEDVRLLSLSSCLQRFLPCRRKKVVDRSCESSIVAIPS